ncbi:sulfatase-like hydrolase/transferase [Leptospira kanakyensis]|uniref:sulfatase-like hydrolase/transferase n=1 Tax=Leptospira kanakyensis TaxID=2484968 RepID=UPI00223E3FF2|nr:sulfatase-like hydrolase/transferase [Leptospira kanakyensis]MCW7479668.1 LTA synthase family protein [Leptospira kanakyensis]
MISKLNKLGKSLRSLFLENLSNLLLYITFYVFLGPSTFSFHVWFYFHGYLITTFTVLTVVLDFFLQKKEKIKKSNRYLLYRLVLWTLFVMILGYQQVYQTTLDLSLVVYFFHHLFILYSDIPNFLYQWNLWQWIGLVIGYYLILNQEVLDLKKDWVKFLFCLLLFVSFRCASDLVSPNTIQNPNLLTSTSRPKTELQSITGTPNIVLVLLEGVPRKHLSKLKSRYIDYSKLSGSHFWIPMPHTSKSLFTWMTGESQLSNTRMQLNDSLLESSLPKLLETKYGYQTEMIYTQSIYFEGMEQFFPKIFGVVWDKSELEKKYGSLHSSFSWGMDDRVILPSIKQISEKENKPIFLFLGLSQTHSPYFVSKKNFDGQWKSPFDRYMESLLEEVEVLDSIISYLKENFSRDTIVILSADHGESFGEEGAHAHNYSLFNQETDVPFLLYFVKSGQIYIPKSGSSIHFKNTLLDLLAPNVLQEDQLKQTNFFKSNYQLDLVSKTWNSEIQKSWITNEKKYIYHSDRDLLLEMDFAEEKRREVIDPKLKQRVLDHIHAEIR